MTTNPATAPARCEVQWRQPLPSGAQALRRCTRRMDDPRLDSHDRHHWNPEAEAVWAVWTAPRAEAASHAEPLEAKRAELRRYTRTLLGPLYTAADVEGAIDKHLRSELEQVQA